MSGLRRLFQSARERNSWTWMEIYWQGGLYASQSGRGLLTGKKFFFRNLFYSLNSICCAICADRDGCSRVCVFPAGFGSNFRIMVRSASGPGSTFKVFLGSAWVRVPLSNEIRVRVGSVRHIYGSLRVYKFLDPWRPLVYGMSSFRCQVNVCALSLSLLLSSLPLLNLLPGHRKHIKQHYNKWPGRDFKTIPNASQQYTFTSTS